jgi:predicted RNase H-like HicB family nuclease
MAQVGRRIAYPLTFVLKQEGNQWAALAPELNVASCGGTLEEARQALEDALETYVSYMISAGRVSEVARPLSQAEVDDFVNDPPGVVRFERWVMFVALDAAEKASEATATEFLPAGLPGAAATVPAGAGE